MKILHLVQHFYPCIGGIEKYVYDLCTNLNRLGHQNDVCCLNTCPYSKKKLKSYEVHKGIRIRRIPSLFKLYKIAPGFIKHIKKYDIIQVHGVSFFSDLLVLTKFIHGKKIIVNTHGGTFHTKRYPLFKKIYFNLWYRMAFKKIDKIIADGENDKKTFSKVSENIDIIPIPIETGIFSRIRRAPEKNRLVYTGRISRNKRIDNLIKTLFFIRKKNPNVKLYIVGSDWQGLRGGLEELAGQKGLESSVIFTGRVSDKELLNHLKKAQLYLFASEYEGGAVISVMEAMAAGVPVVVHKEIERTCKNWLIDGKTGFITDYKKPEKAADLILGLMKKDISSISRNGKDMAKNYDWKEAAKRVEAAYRGCL